MTILLAKNNTTGHIYAYSSQKELFESAEFNQLNSPTNRARVSRLLSPESIYNNFFDWTLKLKKISINEENLSAIFDGNKYCI